VGENGSREEGSRQPLRDLVEDLH